MQIQPAAGERKRVRPDPRLYGGQWVVDFRGAGFGSRYALCKAIEPREEAVHMAYELLARLRGERMAEAGQREVFAEGAPVLFAGALDRWQETKRYDTDGGKAWGDKYARLIRRELGAYRLGEFAPPAGTDRMRSYVESLERQKRSGRTIRNRVFPAMQVLRFALERGWLPALPLLPRLPAKAAPVLLYITEAMFRQLRAAIFPKGTPPSVATAEEIARRRLYLSWEFYTGVHTIDADCMTADLLFLDGRAYVRHNNKSAQHVEDQQFEMPDPLYEDFRELEALLGRPFYPGEAVTGGPWPHAARVMGSAARRLRFPHPVNPRILRRSYVREMVLKGYEVQEIADRMGHVDIKMVREIYNSMPRPGGHPRSRWTLSPSTGGGASPGGMARILQIKGDGGVK